MQKAIAIVLLLMAFSLFYFGIKKMDEKKADVKIGDVEITAKTSESKESAYVLIGAGLVCLVIGVVLVSRVKQNS